MRILKSYIRQKEFMEGKNRRKKMKKKKVRDTWIPQTWRYNGSGYQKDKTKIIERKKKYKTYD